MTAAPAISTNATGTAFLKAELPFRISTLRGQVRVNTEGMKNYQIMYNKKIIPDQREEDNSPSQPYGGERRKPDAAPHVS
jgi:hypothetical protein